MIDDLRAELANIGDQSDVTPQINAVNAELRRIQEEKAKMEGEKADMRREKDNLNGECRRKTHTHTQGLGSPGSQTVLAERLTAPF